MGNRTLKKKKTASLWGSHTVIILHVLIFVCYKKLDCQCTSVYLARKYYSCTYNNIEYTKSCLPPGREHHFTCSSEQHERLVICKANPVPLYFRPWIYWFSLGYPAHNFLHSEVKHSTNWASPSRVSSYTIYYHLYTSYLVVKCSSIWKFTAWNGLPGLGNVLLQTISRTLILILWQH